MSDQPDAARRESIRNLLDRAGRGVLIGGTEGELLRNQVEAELRMADRRAEIADAVTAETKKLLERRTTTLRERAEKAEERAEAASRVGTRYLAAAEKAEAERDGAYRERAHLVALLAAMTDGAVLAPALDLDEPGWWIAYLTLSGRQASWHISPRDAGLFAAVERVDPDDPRAQWDGHTTEAKYAGIAAWTAELMQQCGPECAEMHRGGFRCRP